MHTGPIATNRWRRMLLIMGPGLIVMLADTDAGSIITAAQSGAQTGYQLLLLQVLLIPILFVVQELTLRLGLATGRGHGELIRARFGLGWAFLSVGTLVLSCIGALLTELSGIAGVAQLFGVPAWVAMFLTVTFMIVMIVTGSYRSVERIAILFGLFEFAFLLVAWKSAPSGAVMLREMSQLPLHDNQFLFLAAANIGAVIMPWMIFYQQSAVIDKGLTLNDLGIARLDTGIGAVITQVIMAAVLIATAATLHRSGSRSPLDSVPEIASALTKFLGVDVGRIIFALGMMGAALVATVVVCLTAAWGLGEITGYKRSLEHHPLEAPWFYGIFSLTLAIGGALVASGINLVNLSVAVEVMNALLLPIVLGFLFLLARNALPEPYRLRGLYAYVVGGLMLLTAGLGVYAGAWGIFGS